MFFKRKGFFAMIAQAFCDAFCMFQVFDVLWPGATNDILAYKATELYRQLFLIVGRTIPE